MDLYKANKTKIETGIIYRGRGVLINIGKSRENFDKNGKLRWFNYNTYKYIAKNYQRSKKKKGQESVISTIK